MKNKFTVKVEEAVKKLRVITDVLPTKSLVPELEGICFQQKGNSLIATASDTELIARQKIKADSDNNDLIEFIVPGRKLVNLLSSFPQTSSVEFIVDEGSVRLKQGRSNYKLATYEEYPSMFSDNPKEFLEIEDIEQFVRILNQVLVTVSRDEIKPVLGGCEISIGKKIRMVSLDGPRLTFASMKNKGSYSCDSVIVPLKVLSVLLKNLSEDKPLKISIHDKGWVRFENGFLLYSKLIDGTFPNLETFLYQDKPNQFSVPSQNLKIILDRLAILSVYPNEIALQTSGNGRLKISVNKGGEGVFDGHEGSDEIRISGDCLEMDYRLNLISLREVLFPFSQDSDVVFHFSEVDEPMIVEDSEIDTYMKILIQPVVNNE